MVISPLYWDYHLPLEHVPAFEQFLTKHFKLLTFISLTRFKSAQLNAYAISNSPQPHQAFSAERPPARHFHYVVALSRREGWVIRQLDRLRFPVVREAVAIALAGPGWDQRRPGQSLALLCSATGRMAAASWSMIARASKSFPRWRSGCAGPSARVGTDRSMSTRMLAVPPALLPA